MVKSGILGFDLLVGGGIPENHVIMLQGPTSTENTIFTNQFIKKGLDNYEPVLVVLSKMSAEKFRENLKAIGINAKKFERKGYLKIVDWYSFKSGDIVGDVEEKGGIIYASKDLTNLGIAINRGIKALKDAPVKRAVIDVLSPALNFFEYKRIYNFVQSMVARFKSSNITTIFSMEFEVEEAKML
jgi:KaiC/GvpD/RAD55 family RecA-like ATPase